MTADVLSLIVTIRSRASATESVSPTPSSIVPASKARVSSVMGSSSPIFRPASNTEYSTVSLYRLAAGISRSPSSDAPRPLPRSLTATLTLPSTPANARSRRPTSAGSVTSPAGFESQRRSVAGSVGVGFASTAVAVEGAIWAIWRTGPAAVDPGASAGAAAFDVPAGWRGSFDCVTRWRSVAGNPNTPGSATQAKPTPMSASTTTSAAKPAAELSPGPAPTRAPGRPRDRYVVTGRGTPRLA